MFASRFHLSRASDLVTLARADRLSDLQPSRIQAAPAELRDAGRSLHRCTHGRASIWAFVRRNHAGGRLRDDPMAGVSCFNAVPTRAVSLGGPSL